MDAQKSFSLRRVRLEMTPKKAIALVVAFCILGVLVLVVPGYASTGSVVTLALGYVLEPVLGFLGTLLLNVVAILIWVAQYNDFVNAAPVATGWIIVRDITNMFFIIVLLIIAFGTMLGVEQYSYRNKVLSRFLIMAIVVNFSRTITGLLIDFAQVVMLTFVNGFKEAAGGNFIDALKIGDVMQTAATGEATKPSDIIIGFMVGLMMIGMSLFLMIIMLSVLVVRIIYLWLLIILSPLAFFLKAVPSPAAQKYYAEWWSMFTQHVLVGPVMAFFLWLSLVSVSTGKITAGFDKNVITAAQGEGGSTSAVFNPETLQEFTIAFALLLGGVMMAQRLSPQGAAIGKRATSMATGAAKGLARQGYKRSGAESFVKERGRLKTARQETARQRRGVAIAGGLAAGGGGMAKGMRMMGLMPRANRIGSYREEATRLRNKGGAKNLSKADKLDGKAKELQELKKPEGLVRRTVTGAISKPARILAGADFGGDEVASKMKGDAFSAAQKKMEETRSFPEKQAIAEGAMPAANDDEHKAAIMSMADGTGMEGKIGGMREKMKGLGATGAQMAQFEDSARKNYAMEADFIGKDKVAKEEARTDAIQSGGLKVANMTPEGLEQAAGAISKSDDLTRKKYEREIKRDPKRQEAYSKGLASLDTAESTASMFNMNPASAMKAMNIEDGSFKGDDAEAVKRAQDRMQGALASKAGTDVASKIPASSIINETSGEVSEVGNATVEAVINDPGMLNKMAQKAESPDERNTVSALVEAIKQAAEKNPDDGAAQKAAQRVTQDRALIPHQDYGSATAQREGRAETKKQEKEEATQRAEASEKEEKSQAEAAKTEEKRQANLSVEITQNITNNEAATNTAKSQFDDLKKVATKAAKDGASKAKLDSINNQMSQVKKKIDRLAQAGDNLKKEKKRREAKGRG